METDSELNVAWEATTHDVALTRGIRRLRVSLLAEHIGLRGPAAVRALVAPEGLVARLDALCARPELRLRRHGPPSEGQKTAMALVDPEELPFDPAPSLDHTR
jgi:hypothetical protein